jgi:hypothetical protein
MRLEPRLRELMSDWRFWMGVAYFGLSAVVIALFILFNRTAREEAARAASNNAASSTQVGQCFTQVKTLPLTRGFVAGQEAIVDDSLISTRAALNAAPANDPLHLIRVHALLRLERAKVATDRLRRLIEKETPTRKQCLRLARKLHVDASRYIH